jgi:hypothetical protein
VVNSKLEQYQLVLLFMLLEDKGKNLSIEDEELLRKLIILKSSKGIPKF